MFSIPICFVFLPLPPSFSSSPSFFLSCLKYLPFSFLYSFPCLFIYHYLYPFFHNFHNNFLRFFFPFKLIFFFFLRSVHLQLQSLMHTLVLLDVLSVHLSVFCVPSFITYLFSLIILSLHTYLLFFLLFFVSSSLASIHIELQSLTYTRISLPTLSDHLSVVLSPLS